MAINKKKKTIVVLPAYNAAKTLPQTIAEIPKGVIDDIILVDDASNDDTVKVAKRLGIKHIIQHQKNLGYGGNQKTCYEAALRLGADIVVMIHPDYQYTPKLIEAMVSIIKHEVYPVVFGSRILGKGARKGGMPLYKYIANRILTLSQNLLINQKLSEYHTGYRAYKREVLLQIPFGRNSDDFLFDNQMAVQIFSAGYEIGEVTCPTKYFSEASSINFRRSVIYGLGVLWTSLTYRLHRLRLIKARIFDF